MCIDIATKILTRCLLGALLPLPLAALAADEIADESWNLKGQATYIWQKKPSFNAAYSGGRRTCSRTFCCASATKLP